MKKKTETSFNKEAEAKLVAYSKHIAQLQKQAAKPQPKTKAVAKAVQPERPPLFALMKQQANNVEIMRHYGTMTIKDIVAADNLKGLRQLATEHSEKVTITAVGVLLIDASKSFDKKWSMDKAKEVATEIYFSKYYYLSLEDIYVVLNRIKEYEHQFNAVILRKNLRKYAEIRLTLAEKATYNKHLANEYNDKSEAYGLAAKKKDKTIKAANKKAAQWYKQQLKKK